MKRFTVLLLIMCVASLSQAVVIGNFETGMDNWASAGQGSPTFSFSENPDTVTLGSKSLAVKMGGTGYWVLQWNAPAVPTNLTKVKLQFDLTMIGSEWAAMWTMVGNKIAFNSNSPDGWKEFVSTDGFLTAVDRTTLLPTALDWNAEGTEAVKRTYTLDISNYNVTGITWFAMQMSIQQGTATGAGYFYFDNIHWVDQPNNPDPEDGGVAVIGADTTLSWNNATDSLNEVNVWFGIPPEPNEADPNTILSVDTYKTLLSNIYSETTPGATSSCPMPSLTAGVEYTWCVESDPNTIPVPFWTFTATTNAPPVADAGPEVMVDDMYVYEYADVNDITITLNGSATDDGQVSPLAYAWTQTAGPAATINSPTAAVTTVTLTGGLANTTEAGAAVPYEFQLVADDGQFEDSDTVTVHVNSDSCRATIEKGGFYYYGDIAGPDGAGGNYRDCEVDLYDFAELALNWLRCSNTFEACD